MYTFRKFRKNAKALSPVVASIILIAVTVAVSIAVAAWMGGLTTGFMATEQLTITSVSFTSGGGMVITVSNTGTTAVTISSITVNNVAATGTTTYSTTTSTIPGNTQSAAITLDNTNAWTAGNSYVFKLVSSKGTNFQYNAVAA